MLSIVILLNVAMATNYFKQKEKTPKDLTFDRFVKIQNVQQELPIFVLAL